MLFHFPIDRQLGSFHSWEVMITLQAICVPESVWTHPFVSLAYTPGHSGEFGVRSALCHYRGTLPVVSQRGCPGSHVYHPYRRATISLSCQTLAFSLVFGSAYWPFSENGSEFGSPGDGRVTHGPLRLHCD